MPLQRQSLIAIVCQTPYFRSELLDAINTLQETEYTVVMQDILPLSKQPVEKNYDIIVIELSNPEAYDIESLERINEKYPSTLTIILSPKTPIVTAFKEKRDKRDRTVVLWNQNSSNNTEPAQNYSKNVATVLALIKTQRVHRIRTSIRSNGKLTEGGRLSKEYSLLVIGSSTGGPEALTHIIPKLPANLDVPVLTVQHMPPDFTYRMAISLNEKSNIEVIEAKKGDSVLPGIVYIAPGGRHMTVKAISREPVLGIPDLRIDLNNDLPVNNCRPSVDVLLFSVARQVKSRVLAVILTGMGSDGCKGVEELKSRNAYCITQSKETCVVYGMPKAVVDAGLSDEQVPLDLIASRVTQLINNPSVKTNSV